MWGTIKYIIVDSRTGKQACSGVWTRDMAENMIEQFKERQANGGRPDLSLEDVNALTVREQED